MKGRILITLIIGTLLASYSCQAPKDTSEVETINWNNEVIYHVMPRSFYDSNGDRHGDLNGFVQKLDYLKELGVTTILFTPLYESGFYHNYFPTDYEKIDQEYGTMDDYINFVKAVHAKGLKFLMDMETQYAQGEHRWFAESFKNPGSQYDDYIYYTDSLNEYPEQIFLPSKSPMTLFKCWPADEHYIVFLDLDNPKMKQWQIDFYSFWVDPNGDGKFDDGVDGFRIDHIMDDLDYKGLFTNMYTDFWKPIFEACQTINPNIFVLGEQSNWNHYGDEMVSKSGATAAFSFPLRFALAGGEGVHDMYTDPDALGVKMDPERLHKVVEETMSKFSNGTYFINFLENHDTNRWADVVHGNEGQLYVGAILNVLLPGVPSIYYGQELGLPGTVGDWGSDVNHIPVREAFPWTANVDDTGIAAFYKGTGAWWDQSIYTTENIANLALSNQRGDSGSLWNHYKTLLSIRHEHEAFRIGDYKPIQLPSGLMGFKRSLNGASYTVIINLSDQNQDVSRDNLDLSGLSKLAGNADISGRSIAFAPYSFVILSK